MISCGGNFRAVAAMRFTKIEIGCVEAVEHAPCFGLPVWPSHGNRKHDFSGQDSHSESFFDTVACVHS